MEGAIVTALSLKIFCKICWYQQVNRYIIYYSTVICVCGLKT